jgi:hypothetical protein
MDKLRQYYNIKSFKLFDNFSRTLHLNINVSKNYLVLKLILKTRILSSFFIDEMQQMIFGQLEIVDPEHQNCPTYKLREFISFYNIIISHGFAFNI